MNTHGRSDRTDDGRERDAWTAEDGAGLNSGVGRESVGRLGRLDAAAVVAVFEAAVDALIVINARGVIQAVNSSALENFGYGHESDLIGNGVAMLMPEPDASRHDGYLDAYGSTRERKIIGIGREVTGRRRDGSHFPMHLSISEFEAEGERRFLGICHDVTERRAFMDQITAMARVDVLTGFANRTEGIRFLTEHVAAADQSGGGVGLIFIDLDEFKGVNDHHGHTVGDRVLQVVSERMRGQTPRGGMIARMGGDEFLVIHPFTTAEGIAAVAATADRMVRAIGEPVHIDARQLHLGASAGISSYPSDGSSVEDLIGVADIAMYDAKRSATDCVRHFHPELKEKADQQYDLLVRLRQGIEDEAFELHYQVQFDLTTLEPVGLEALVRWRDPERGLVGPADWMDLALHSGLTPAIGRWVIERACRDNASLIGSGLLDVPVSVNVCAPLFGDRGFIDLLRTSMRRHRLPVNRLEIEVVEGAAMTAAPTLMENVRVVSAAGISIAMDDFGTGFSSLQQLHQGYFTKLKIDRSFVSRLPGHANDRAMVRAMLDLARGLGIDTVAEGVEHADQRVLLRDMGCSKAQGFWYARPVPLEQLAETVESGRALAGADLAASR